MILIMQPNRFILFISKLIRFWLHLPLFRLVVYRIKHSGLTIGFGADLDIQGDFEYQSHCSIGEGANIIVPANAKLRLGCSNYLGRSVEIGVGGLIALGDYSSIQDRCILLGDVSVGRYCLFASNVYVSSGRHYFDLHPPLLIKDQDVLVRQNAALLAEHSQPVVIEDDCWLGANVVVLRGVRIAKGAVIGANSVVTKDVPPYAVFAGAPAKFIKQRMVFLPPSQIQYDNQDDLPYFYSGIEVDLASRIKHAEVQGLVAHNDFKLCLNSDGKKMICMVVKGLNCTEVIVFFNGEQQVVTDVFQEVSFNLSNDIDTTFNFRMESNHSDGKLLIQKAWVR